MLASGYLLSFCLLAAAPAPSEGVPAERPIEAAVLTHLPEHRLVSVNNINAHLVCQLITQGFGFERGRPDGAPARLMADDRTGRILIVAPPGLADGIARLIEQLDAPRDQASGSPARDSSNVRIDAALCVVAVPRSAVPGLTVDSLLPHAGDLAKLAPHLASIGTLVGTYRATQAVNLRRGATIHIGGVSPKTHRASTAESAEPKPANPHASTGAKLEIRDLGPKPEEPGVSVTIESQTQLDSGAGAPSSLSFRQSYDGPLTLDTPILLLGAVPTPAADDRAAVCIARLVFSSSR